MTQRETDKYLINSERTEKKFPAGMTLSQYDAELLHALMGLTTESGEAMDAFKKHIIYGKPIDAVNILEELGDSLWYIAIAIRLCGADFEQVMEANIEKLKKRFPDKFTEEKALERNLDVERQSLESNLAVHS